MMKKFLHKIYVLIGKMINSLCLCYWRLRDFINKPNEKAVLFVAHPDDDVLFFHTFIKEHKPYVVLLTDGWSFKRMSEFKKVMKMYGLRYRAYPLHTRDKRCDLLEKYIKICFKIADFKICATHNATGEYGHEMHIRVHNAVKKAAECDLYIPVSSNDLKKFPLPKNIAQEKIEIFNKFYSTQLFVLDMYGEWVENEKLIKVE